MGDSDGGNRSVVRARQVNKVCQCPSGNVGDESIRYHKSARNARYKATGLNPDSCGEEADRLYFMIASRMSLPPVVKYLYSVRSHGMAHTVLKFRLSGEKFPQLRAPKLVRQQRFGVFETNSLSSDAARLGGVGLIVGDVDQSCAYAWFRKLAAR